METSRFRLLLQAESDFSFRDGGYDDAGACFRLKIRLACGRERPLTR